MGRLFKEMFVIFMGVAAFVYLIYPSLGVFELLPDALPLIGSIDEGTASLILISVLRYYGLDVTRLFGKRFSQGQHPMIPQGKTGQAGTIEGEQSAPANRRR